MRDEHDANPALDTRLAAARAALQSMRAGPGLEPALRQAHRDRAARRAAVDAAPATARARRWSERPAWIGAGAGLAAGLLVAAWLLPGLRAPESDDAGTDVPAPPFAAATDALPAAAGPQPRPFQPVAHYYGTPASQSYLILRARVPVAALTIDTGDYVDGTVEADLLIGDDGLIAGIRFDDVPSSPTLR